MRSQYLNSKLVQHSPDGCVQCYLGQFLNEVDHCIQKTEGMEVICL